MAGLPKKYAKMGFKKGWRAFKASKNKRKTKRATTKRSSKVTKVRRKSKFNTDLITMAGAMGYGAVREKVSNMLEPLTQKVPAGDVSDEVAMGALSYLMMKGKIPVISKYPVMKAIGRAGFIIESARAGQYLANNVGLSMKNTGSAGAPNKALQVTIF